MRTKPFGSTVTRSADVISLLPETGEQLLNKDISEIFYGGVFSGCSNYIL